MESHGTEIRINFIGWDSKFDETLDLLRDSNRISEFGTKSTEQTSKSVAMNRSPSSLRKSLTGNFISPSKSPITSVASPGSDIKKPLVDSTDGLTSPASATKTPHRSGKVKFSDDDAQIKNASSQESDSTNVTGVSVASGGRPTHGLNRAPSIENRISITSDSGSGSNLVPSTTQPKGAEQAHVLNIPAAPAVATDVSTTANDANTSKPNAPVKPVTESKETKSGKGFSLFRGAVKSSEKMIADSSEASTSATKSEKGSKGSADGNGQSTITTESNSTDNARPQSSYYTNSINASRAIFKSIMQFVQSKKSDGSSSGALGNGTDGAAKESKSLEDKQVEELMAQTAEEMKEEIEREKKFIEELGKQMD